MRLKLLNKILQYVDCTGVRFQNNFPISFEYSTDNEVNPRLEIHLVSFAIHEHFQNRAERDYIKKTYENLIKNKYNINLDLKYMQRYALTILHEIGHYKHYLEIGHKEFTRLMKEQHNKEHGYIQYREQPLEKYADEYAVDRFYEIFLKDK